MSPANPFVSLRFSPACAGNPLLWSLPSPCTPVQPRVRGEPSSASLAAERLIGSAPRARGTRAVVAGHGELLRFSPACAGNPTRGPRAAVAGAVQPRVRGEPGALRGGVALEVGSAPRARGTHHKRDARGVTGRFSPACAGNPRPSSQGPTPRPVQPRVRGEPRPSPVVEMSTVGSAPRARGTQPIPQPPVEFLRFSPACAGNPSPGRPQSLE